MKKYAEVLSMIKRAYSPHMNAAIQRARRARQLIRKQRGTAQETQATPAVSTQPMPSFKQRRDAQSMKLYGKPWADVQRQADMKFANDRYRNTARNIVRARDFAGMFNDPNKVHPIYNKALEDARNRRDAQISQIQSRNYANPTWQQAMEMYGSKAGPVQFSDADRQYYRQVLMPSMRGSNPEYARAAAWDAMRRGAAPDIQDVDSRMNPAAIQQIYQGGYTPPSGQAMASSMSQIPESQIQWPAQGNQQAVAQAQPAKPTYIQQLNPSGGGYNSTEVDYGAPVPNSQNQQLAMQQQNTAKPLTENDVRRRIGATQVSKGYMRINGQLLPQRNNMQQPAAQTVRSQPRVWRSGKSQAPFNQTTRSFNINNRNGVASRFI